LAGVAALYGMGTPIDVRLSGVKIDQPDLPWWAVACLGWLGTVRAIQEGYGETAAGYRKALKLILETGSPTRVYILYKDYVAAMEAEANRK
jgi:hypothetical protein